MPSSRLKYLPVKILGLLIVTLGLPVSPLRAAAVTAVSNFGQPTSTTIAVGKTSGFDFQQAINFVTGPATSELSRVTLHGNSFENLTGFSVVLCTGLTSTGPTGVVATLANDSPSDPGIVLAASTNYWLVALAPNTELGSGFAWRSAATFDEDGGGLPGWSIGDTRWVSNDGGASWRVATGPVPQITVLVNVLPAIAPAITVQPKSQTAVGGTNVKLSVTATGNPLPAFQWRKDGADIPGATQSTLNLNPVSPSDAGRYSVLVSNSAGSVTSGTATVEVIPIVAAVSNLAQTNAFNTAVGKDSGRDFQQAASFTTGPAITELSRITLQGFGLNNVSSLTVSLHRGINAAGSTGLIATLAGNTTPTALAGYTYSPPSPVTLSPNSTYWLIVSAPNTAPSSAFEWRTTNSLDGDEGGLAGWTIGNTRWVSSDGGASWQAVGTPIPQFTVEVTVSPATPPIIVIPPTSQVATAGSSVTLSVVSGGNPAPTYQWLKDGVALPGATNTSLTLTAVSRSSSGAYSVVLANSAGSATSPAALVDVIPGSAFSNFAVRTAMAADQVVIIGAVITGGAKPILVRAAGPALNGFNLAGMADPRLELYTTGAQPTAINDDWPAALAATFTSVGAFPFASGSKDAALSQSLLGPFTIQAKGPGAGILLIEAYDVAGGTSARMINFSVRNRVGTGSDILIAGFTLSGTGSKQVLIRAVGPGLAALGVQGTLTDPGLQVLNSNGAVIGSNNNWDAALAPVFAQVGAFALPANSRDSALLISLNAGASYTVQVSGADGGTGEALVELYEVF